MLQRDRIRALREESAKVILEHHGLEQVQQLYNFGGTLETPGMEQWFATRNYDRKGEYKPRYVRKRTRTVDAVADRAPMSPDRYRIEADIRRRLLEFRETERAEEERKRREEYLRARAEEQAGEEGGGTIGSEWGVWGGEGSAVVGMVFDDGGDGLVVSEERVQQGGAMGTSSGGAVFWNSGESGGGPLDGGGGAQQEEVTTPTGNRSTGARSSGNRTLRLPVGVKTSFSDEDESSLAIPAASGTGDLDDGITRPRPPPPQRRPAPPPGSPPRTIGRGFSRVGSSGGRAESNFEGEHSSPLRSVARARQALLQQGGRRPRRPSTSSLPALPERYPEEDDLHDNPPRRRLSDGFLQERTSSDHYIRPGTWSAEQRFRPGTSGGSLVLGLHRQRSSSLDEGSFLERRDSGFGYDIVDQPGEDFHAGGSRGTPALPRGHRQRRRTGSSGGGSVSSSRRTRASNETLQSIHPQEASLSSPPGFSPGMEDDTHQHLYHILREGAHRMVQPDDDIPYRRAVAASPPGSDSRSRRIQTDGPDLILDGTRSGSVSPQHSPTHSPSLGSLLPPSEIPKAASPHRYRSGPLEQPPQPPPPRDLSQAPPAPPPDHTSGDSAGVLAGVNEQAPDHFFVQEDLDSEEEEMLQITLHPHDVQRQTFADYVRAAKVLRKNLQIRWRKWYSTISWSNWRSYAFHHHLGILQYRAMAEKRRSVVLYTGRNSEWDMYDIMTDVAQGKLRSAARKAEREAALFDYSRAKRTAAAGTVLRGGRGGGDNTMGDRGVKRRTRLDGSGMSYSRARSFVGAAAKYRTGTEREREEEFRAREKSEFGTLSAPRLDFSEYDVIYANPTFIFAHRVDMAVAYQLSLLLHVVLVSFAWYFRYLDHPGFERSVSRLHDDRNVAALGGSGLDHWALGMFANKNLLRANYDPGLRQEQPISWTSKAQRRGLSGAGALSMTETQFSDLMGLFGALSCVACVGAVFSLLSFVSVRDYTNYKCRVLWERIVDDKLRGGQQETPGTASAGEERGDGGVGGRGARALVGGVAARTAASVGGALGGKKIGAVVSDRREDVLVVPPHLRELSLCFSPILTPFTILLLALFVFGTTAQTLALFLETTEPAKITREFENDYTETELFFTEVEQKDRAGHWGLFPKWFVIYIGLLHGSLALDHLLCQPLLLGVHMWLGKPKGPLGAGAAVAGWLKRWFCSPRAEGRRKEPVTFTISSKAGGLEDEDE